MPKPERNNFFQGVVSNPITILVAIMLVFAALFYFFKPDKEANNNEAIISSYQEDESWLNSEAVKGSENALLALVEYGDYQCPACGDMYGTVEEIISQYNGEIKLIYRHYPLSFHQFAFKASVAAECAGEQGKFWEMHDKLYKNRNKLGDKDLKKYAEEIGLDVGRFEKCFDNNGYAKKINKQKELGDKDNIQGTPTFFLNGKRLKNAENEKLLPKPEDFKQAIDKELEQNR